MVVIYFWLISFRLPPGAQYVRCRTPRCTEADRKYLFPGHVDTNSLVVQDEYVFTQVCIVIDYFLFLIKLNIMSSSFQCEGSRVCELWFFLGFLGYFIWVSLSIKTHVMTFPNTHLFPTSSVCVLIMFCLVHVKAGSVFARTLSVSDKCDC